MLPEFPKLQMDLAALMQRFVIHRIRHHLGGLVHIPWTTIHEGHGNAITRVDGTTENTDMIAASSELLIPFDDLTKLTVQGLAARWDKIAQDLARQQAEAMFAAIGRGAASVGNSFDAAGQPLTPEPYLKVIDKIEMDFDDNGKARFPTLHIGPEMEEKARTVIETVLTDPDLSRQFETIMTKKLGDWRAREARRELAG